MAKSNLSTQRRINLVIQERHNPGLLELLERVPDGDVNGFIRNVLLHWFDVHDMRGDIDEAVKRTLLYDKLRSMQWGVDCSRDLIRKYADDNSVSDKSIRPMASFIDHVSNSQPSLGAQNNESNTVTLSAKLEEREDRPRVSRTAPGPMASTAASSSHSVHTDDDDGFDPDAF